MIWLLTALCMAAPPASIDLDGDGKGEVVKVAEDGVKIGKHTVECYSDDGAGCEVREVDITSADKQKEVVVCYAGPRDDRNCDLYRLVDNELKQIPIGKYGGAESLSLTGSGFLYATNGAHRLFQRTSKYVWKDGKMVLVPQPIYTADTPASMHIDQTFKLLLAPDSAELVGNTKADSDIAVLGEHGEKEGWLLVRLSSGISGWVHVDTLQKVSQQYMQIMSAG